MAKLNRRTILHRGGLALLGAGALSRTEPAAQAQRGGSKPEECNCARAADGSPLDTGASEIRPVIERYEVELRDLNRIYALPGSAARQTALERFYTDQLRLVEKVNFDVLSQAGRVDYLLIRDLLLRDRRQLANEARQEAEIAPLIPFQRPSSGWRKRGGEWRPSIPRSPPPR